MIYEQMSAKEICTMGVYQVGIKCETKVISSTEFRAI